MIARTFATALLALAFLAGCADDGEKPGRADATVEWIVDGDTLVLTDRRRVRLVQIDAPEKRDGECYADEAAAALEDLAPAGSSVTLEADPALDDIDRFERILRYVFREGENVNLELARRGAAAPWFFDGDRGRYAEQLLAAAEEAREASRGLWHACPGTRLDPSRAVGTG
jgi:micrococcal nuclease